MGKPGDLIPDLVIVGGRRPSNFSVVSIHKGSLMTIFRKDAFQHALPTGSPQDLRRGSRDHHNDALTGHYALPTGGPQDLPGDSRDHHNDALTSQHALPSRDPRNDPRDFAGHVNTGFSKDAFQNVVPIEGPQDLSRDSRDHQNDALTSQHALPLYDPLDYSRGALGYSSRAGPGLPDVDLGLPRFGLNMDNPRAHNSVESLHTNAGRCAEVDVHREADGSGHVTHVDLGTGTITHENRQQTYL